MNFTPDELKEELADQATISEQMGFTADATLYRAALSYILKLELNDNHNHCGAPPYFPLATGTTARIAKLVSHLSAFRRGVRKPGA